METKTAKTIRETATVDNRIVVAVNCTCSDTNYNLSIDVIDKEYCAAHKEELQEFVAGVISRANGLSEEYNLPIIRAK